jgi:hypothetical protein
VESLIKIGGISAKKMSEKLKIGISIGDVNGVGLEIIIKTLADARIYDYCTPLYTGIPKLRRFTGAPHTWKTLLLP